jgi:hypothetical protein
MWMPMDRKDVVLYGIIGILTFQVPFALILLPELQATIRLTNGLSYIEVHASNGTVFPVDCANVESLSSLPKCFDANFNSYGYCVGETQAEWYKIYGRLYADGWQNGVNTTVPGFEWVNSFSQGLNPSMMSGGRYWCDTNVRLYDPEQFKGRFYFEYRTEPLDFVDWFLTFTIGGLMGIFIVCSIAVELCMVYLIFEGLVKMGGKMWSKISTLRFPHNDLVPLETKLEEGPAKE